MDLGNLASLGHFLPELLLTAGVIVLVVVDLILRDKTPLGDLALIITAGALVLMIALSACSGSSGTPAGTYNLTVTGTGSGAGSGNTETQTVTIAFTVT